MNYNESVAFLNSTKSYGSHPGLVNINNLLNEINNPEKSLKAIHLAGTNGKGSTSTIINQILIEAGYKTGLFNSPYILSLKETIRINNIEMSKDMFAKVTTIIRDACNRIVSNNKPHPTIFECITAISLYYFSKKKVDFAIIETGLGGRYDATNVFTSPLLSIITAIDFDHTGFLGNTIEEITYQKAGIIKPGSPVVLSQNPTNVVNIIKRVCNDNGSRLYYSKEDAIDLKIHSSSREETLFNLRNNYASYQGLKTRLIGSHQLVNINTALTAIEVIKGSHIVDDFAIYNGLFKAMISSRCEYYIYSGNPILLDGAHNHQSMDALTHVLDDYFNDLSIDIIFGALGDKDIDSMLKSLSRFSSVITLTNPISERAADLNDVKKLALNYFETVTIYETPLVAFDSHIKKESNNSLLIITGSLYLTTYIKNHIVALDNQN